MTETELLEACRLANRAALQVMGVPNVCREASHALAAYLGDGATVERVDARIFPADRTLGSCFGSAPRAEPGMWAGHLVTRYGSYVLDPTIDSGNNPEWSFKVEPLVFAVPDSWDLGVYVRVREDDQVLITYQKYHRQMGWSNLRQWHWREILDVMRDDRVLNRYASNAFVAQERAKARFELEAARLAVQRRRANAEEVPGD